MPGIRRIPGTYPDYTELPEFTRITLGSSENPTAPRKGCGGVGLGGPLPVMWTGLEEGPAGPLNRTSS
eukprot:1247090-Prymnesium_polylepis.1